ncbi:hypothetical protein DT603_14520 [Pseudoxanthomonas gei]|uniref:Uncharacterized protein n=1 Tax=Pseudoxanthomonas gei TaxID=1383030 RepID=A0ABX0AEL8_9GAMM|nr:hypothetical protein [Pseudoxanthomonas gei]
MPAFPDASASVGGKSGDLPSTAPPAGGNPKKHRIAGRLQDGDQVIAHQPRTERQGSSDVARRGFGSLKSAGEDPTDLLAGMSGRRFPAIVAWVTAAPVFGAVAGKEEAPAAGRGFVGVCDGASTRKLAQTVLK